MTRPTRTAAASPLWVVYLATVFLLSLSGFAQMPIFKRYYIADIPGLGWLAEFYVTHYLHYVGAIVLLALLAYVAVRFLVVWRRDWQLSASGYLRAILLAGILLTGVLRVIKNFPEIYMSSGLIIFLDLLHLAAVMAFLTVNLYCLVRRRQWMTRAASIPTAGHSKSISAAAGA